MKMNLVLQPRRAPLPLQLRLTWCVLWLIVAGLGCQREQIQVYTAPKDKAVTPPAVADSPMPKTKPARPQVSWTLPRGWKEKGPGQMSVASFTIQGPGDQEAQVTITPLAQLAGRDAEIVNMWREQVGLEPLSKEEATKQFEAVDVGGEKGNLFQIQGKPQAGSGAARIVTAMVHRSDASWFYKLAGGAELRTEAEGPDIAAFEQAECERIGVPAAIGMRHRLTHFAHLFSGSAYAAGYYVYLWAEVLDADGFDAFVEAGNPFDPKVAERLRRYIYSSGNTLEPGEAYRAFRGRAAKVEPMLKKRGLLETSDAA